MPHFEPLEGKIGDVGTYHISDEALHGRASVSPEEARDKVTTTKAAFQRSLVTHNANAAEHYYLWLLKELPQGEVLDELLPLAIARNNMDDHNFIYPVYTARALDEIGWEWASVLFRPAVRYQARQTSHLVSELRMEFSEIEAVVDEYKLLEREIPLHSSEAETETIGALGAAMGSNKNYAHNIRLMAEALADGLSLQRCGRSIVGGLSAGLLEH